MSLVVALTLGLPALLAASTDWYPYDVDSWATGAEGSSQEICKKGHMQSPVELPNCGTHALTRPALSLSWGSHLVELMNNGHTVQLTLEDSKDARAAIMDVRGAKYKLIQCHFHWGSEHTIGGRQQDLVAHCVHMKLAQGREMRFGVLAIFYEVGDTEDPFLKSFEDELPMASGDSRWTTVSAFKGPVNFDMSYSGMNMTHYWTYPGSLTTPPCTEAVDWYPLMAKRSMLPKQYNKFKAAIGWKVEGGNFRPPQLLYGRQVVGCTWGPAEAEEGSGSEHDWYPYDARTWAKSVENSNPICANGHMQSPVELPLCDVPEARPEVTLKWGSHPVELKNNGHTVQLTLKDDKIVKESTMKVGNATYKLLQCHFHWGSEHTIGGKQQAVVAHCVHVKQAKGREMRFGVVGIFYEVGNSSDPFLASFEDNLPHIGESAESHRRLGHSKIANFTGPVDFDMAFAGMDLNHYWTYPGSLTTPPCTEAVDWFPMMQKKMMSQAQYNKLKSAIGWSEEAGNFRPPQLLYGRKVLGCAEPGTISAAPAKRVAKTNWRMTGLVVVGIVVLFCGVLAALGYWVRKKMLAHEEELKHAVPEGIPTDSPIIIKSLSSDGLIQEWQCSKTGAVYSKERCEITNKPSWKMLEAGRRPGIGHQAAEMMSSFARQISPSMKRQTSPSPQSSPRKNSTSSSSSLEAMSPLRQCAKQQDLLPMHTPSPKPLNSSGRSHQVNAAPVASRIPCGLSCFLPYFMPARRQALPPPPQYSIQAKHLGKQGETMPDDLMLGA